MSKRSTPWEKWRKLDKGLKSKAPLRLLRLMPFAVVLVASLWCWMVTSRYSGPFYRGHSLLYWFTASDPDGYVNQRDAVKALGTNALPTFLSWMQAKPPWFTLPRFMERVFMPVDSVELHWTGARGIALLGSNASVAIPQIVELTKASDSNVRFVALSSLYHLMPRREIVLPVLLKLEHDPSRVVAKEAREYLQILSYDEMPSSGARSPQQRSATPAGSNTSATHN